MPLDVIEAAISGPFLAFNVPAFQRQIDPTIRIVGCLRRRQFIFHTTHSSAKVISSFGGFIAVSSLVRRHRALDVMTLGAQGLPSLFIQAAGR